MPHAPRALKQLQLALRSKAEPGAERSAAGAQIQKKNTDEMNSAYAGIAFATASAMKNVPQSFYPVDTLPSNACLITPLYVHCQKISVHSTPVVLYTMAKRVHGGDALEDSPAAQVSVVATYSRKCAWRKSEEIQDSVDWGNSTLPGLRLKVPTKTCLEPPRWHLLDS